MDPESVAFWGITLKPGDPTDLELKMGESLHVTMASYGPQLKDKEGRSVVTVKVGDSEKKFAVCALSAGKAESTMLDIHFTGEEKVTFTLSGKNEIHLVGNFMFVDLGDSDDMEEEEDLIDVYDDGAMGEQSDDSEEVEAPTLMIDNDPPIITEVKEGMDEDEVEDEEEEEKEPVKLVKGKKGKQSKTPVKANGKTPEKQSTKTPEKQSGKKAKAEKMTKIVETKVDKVQPEADKAKAKKEKVKGEAVNAPDTPAKQKSAMKKTGKSKTVGKSEEKTGDEKPTPVQSGKRKNVESSDAVTPSKKVKNDKKAVVEKTPQKEEANVPSDEASGGEKSAKRSSSKKKKNRRRGKANSS